MLGTQFPGDSGQVRALANLFEERLVPSLHALDGALGSTCGGLFATWTGPRAEAAQQALNRGRPKVRMLIDVINTSVGELRTVAERLDAAQDAVTHVKTIASEADLSWHDEMVRKPLMTDYGLEPDSDPTAPAVRDAQQSYEEALEAYRRAEQRLSEAIAPILDDLARMDDEIETLSTGMLSHADFVNFTTGRLGELYSQRRPDAGGAKRVVQLSSRAAPVLAISGAVIDIAEGEGVGRSVVAHAAGYSAGVAGVRLVLCTVRSLGPIGFALSVLVGVMSTYAIPEHAGQMYDKVMEPEPSLEKLRAQPNEDRWPSTKELNGPAPFCGPM